MKIAKRDIAVIMILLGAILAFCAFKFGYSPAMETVEAEEAKQAELQADIDEIKKVAGTEPQMNREMDEWASEIEDALKKYNVSYSYEDGILWMKQIEDAAAASGNPVIEAYTVNEIPWYSLGTTVEGMGRFAGTTYGYGTTTYSFSYNVTTYEELKAFIDYIVTPATRDGVKTISSMTFSIDSGTSAISGTVNMTVYVLTDALSALEYQPPAVDGVTQGVGNIFGTPAEVIGAQ